MAERCPGCGHNFYDDAPVRDGMCKWCVAEKIAPAVTYSPRRTGPTCPKCGSTDYTDCTAGESCDDCDYSVSYW